MNIKYHYQNGFMLVMSLIFLVVLTVLATAGLNTSTVTEKTAQNSRSLIISFQAAESGLRDGEKWIKTLNLQPTPVGSCANTPCDVWEISNLPDFLTQSDSWWQTNARNFSSTMGIGVSDPKHFIEEVNFIPDDLSIETQANGIGVFFYQVTSRGVGSTSTAESIVQSTFTHRFN